MPTFKKNTSPAMKRSAYKMGGYTYPGVSPVKNGETKTLKGTTIFGHQVSDIKKGFKKFIEKTPLGITYKKFKQVADIATKKPTTKGKVIAKGGTEFMKRAEFSKLKISRELRKIDPTPVGKIRRITDSKGNLIKN